VETAKNVQKNMAEFRTEWATKFNELKGRLDNIVPAIAQQFAQLQANSQITAQCVDNIDLQQQSIMKIEANLYAKLGLLEAQFSTFLDQQHGVELDSLTVDQEAVKIAAMDTFIAIAEQSVALAQEERAAAIKARDAAQAAAVAEAESKKEADVAEAALQSAVDEDRIAGAPGGPCVEPPAGAEVFGG
jgi:hypothetical protein